MAIIKLTPRLFREFDILVRTKAGCCLSVFDWMDDQSCFAYYSHFPEGVYLNSEVTGGPGCCCEKTFIKVSNQINTDRFAKDPRPEMNFGVIPKDDIYKFLILHEISHRLFDLLEINLPIFPTDMAKVRLFFLANELRADRYAWYSLFPGEAFPERTDKDVSLLDKIGELMDSHKEWFPRDPEKIDPISTDPKEMIPVSHIKEGIPWA